MSNDCYEHNPDRGIRHKSATAKWTNGERTYHVCDACLKERLDLYYWRKAGRMHWEAIVPNEAPKLSDLAEGAHDPAYVEQLALAL